MGSVLEPVLNSGFSFANLHSGNMDSYTNKCVILGGREANTSTAAFQNFATIWSIPATLFTFKQDRNFLTASSDSFFVVLLNISVEKSLVVLLLNLLGSIDNVFARLVASSE